MLRSRVPSFLSDSSAWITPARKSRINGVAMLGSELGQRSVNLLRVSAQPVVIFWRRQRHDFFAQSLRNGRLFYRAFRSSSMRRSIADERVGSQRQTQQAQDSYGKFGEKNPPAADRLSICPPSKECRLLASQSDSVLPDLGDQPGSEFSEISCRRLCTRMAVSAVWRMEPLAAKSTSAS